MPALTLSPYSLFSFGQANSPLITREARHLYEDLLEGVLVLNKRVCDRVCRVMPESTTHSQVDLVV